jgi:hypothetical protein
LTGATAVQPMPEFRQRVGAFWAGEMSTGQRFEHRLTVRIILRILLFFCDFCAYSCAFSGLQLRGVPPYGVLRVAHGVFCKPVKSGKDARR